MSTPNLHPRSPLNPGPLALLCFATTTCLTAAYIVRLANITNFNLALGMAFITGGAGQIIAAMWAFGCGATLGATTAGTYGSFWIALGLMNWPDLNITSSYTGASAGQLHNAFGLLYGVWFILSVFITLAYLRSTIALFLTLFFFDIAMFCLMIGGLHQIEAWTKSGGYFFIIVASCAAYEAVSELYTPDLTWVSLPRPMMPHNPWLPKRLRSAV